MRQALTSQSFPLEPCTLYPLPFINPRWCQHL